MNNIPPVDLKQQYEAIASEVAPVVLEVLASGRYIGGPVVEAFEAEFAQSVGTSECVACNSGTDALFLALRALDIGPGDEVITSPFTFIATAEAIILAGATPVFVDIEAQTFNLDLQQVEAAITPRTRALLPVHLFGQPVDMTRLMAIAQAHQLAVVEDCAQATGAEWAGQTVGSIGHVGCFSFFPTKNLGACGDGGAVTTHDPAIAAAVRMLREHGSKERYLHEAVGVNSRLDAIQAAILRAKLKHLPAWNQQRRQRAARYHELLQPLPHITCPQAPTGGVSTWNQYTIRVKSQSPDRDTVRNRLQAKGISSMVYYPLPLHLQPVYQNLGYQPGQFPVAEQACQEVLSLPMFPDLTEEQQLAVTYGLKDSLTLA
ncbi:DegT/DnrJ/EryC1/StrS family aminotransferase [Desertifilum sp. FACHB-1129]|uniref:DegT/DnrJ/EryC1/StrS family aminotransferase n=1 Tax=Desertifilum TaxID=1185872 RepID=UPI0009F2BEC8|nr:DegT/DnrJ/EryC1/StrS family aminotransferase [Desertifilum tharense]MBD2312042.1 DegT/DnrJ/EryC1/StrS family aminotransferase [Desertifilum sp. FACHB-1129]MBD2322495.1 DegT/DnrJ/EryC1/StrS family aminotransferase [Desertifilum sp. FACHB-866]MBD2332658.1 DegT/DnrJ/EryC1/StrS family aminotransferase [Desertifilum sp. FACHB-868]MDA0211813.1 DegT/DnrJ/EryC1/StrS family aminotransferase [Cyanobacteria bacterium FC1]